MNDVRHTSCLFLLPHFIPFKQKLMLPVLPASQAPSHPHVTAANFTKPLLGVMSLPLLPRREMKLRALQ